MKLTFRRVRDTKRYGVFEQIDVLDDEVKNHIYLPKSIKTDEFSVDVPEVAHESFSA